MVLVPSCVNIVSVYIFKHEAMFIITTAVLMYKSTVARCDYPLKQALETPRAWKADY